MHQSCRFAARFVGIFAIFILSLTLAPSAWAANAPKTLHDFYVNNNDGSSVYSGLTLDAAGNAYGTTVEGGTRNAGIVFRLSPTKNGAWKETVLYDFTGGADGANPHSTPIFDNAGNLYGTTFSGGSNTRMCSGGCGVIFKLTPAAKGPWTETVLYQFTGGTDGGSAYAGVIQDSVGNLYGTTLAGGTEGFGTVYELTPSGGVWQETVLYSFGGKPDGFVAYATLILDSAGNLYGTTYQGGANNRGTVYELINQGAGAWTEQLLYSFKSGNDGDNPFAGVTLDQAGNLYGTTVSGGTANVGIAFELSAANGWKETILHQFLGVGSADGANPNGLTFDKLGNLYGTSVGGGKFNPGTIFRLTPNAGRWKETVLYSFTGGNDGAYPSAGLTIDAAGHLYGTTLWGGPAGDTVGGVAFEFIP